MAPGAQLAVVEGDPSASSGDFTVRLKMPDGYKIAPHWHPKRENVAVITGNFKVGMGDKFEESKMMTFPAGSFAYLDPEMHSSPQIGAQSARKAVTDSLAAFATTTPDPKLVVAIGACRGRSLSGRRSNGR